MSTSRLLHLHIPKTGGVALREYFCRQLGSGRVSSTLLGLRLNDALLRWRHTDVISGHFNLYQGDVLPRDRLCLTVLRDPLDRFLSEFFFLRNNNETRLLDAHSRDLDLDGHIENQLAQPSPPLLQMELLFPLGARADAQLGLDEKLVAAKSGIDTFDLVGVQDALEDFCCMIAARMHWPQCELSRSNVTRQRLSVSNLSAVQRRAIENLLGAEIELYQYARATFQRQRRACLAAQVVSSATRAPGPADEQVAVARTTVGPPREFGDRRCEIHAVAVTGEISGLKYVAVGERITINIRFVVGQPVERICIGIAIRDESGALMHGTNSRLLGYDYALSAGTYDASFSFFNRLGLGSYRVDCALTPTGSHHDGCHHWLDQAAHFDVHDNAACPFEGRVLLDHDLSLTLQRGARAPLPVTAQPAHLPVRTYGRVDPPLHDFRACIEPLSNAQTLSRGVDAFLPLRIRNTGVQVWPSLGRNPVCLSYRWFAADRLLVADGLRTPLPGDLTAGSSVTLSLQLQVPDEPGEYRLQISLVQEGVAWFVDGHPASGVWMVIQVP
jgi:hypothetical protein